MGDRERKILEAATRVFLRYGVKRASIGDIAAEAGVARQTLYNTYTNKDDILRSSIRMFGIDAIAAIEAELPQQQSLPDSIGLVLRETAMKPFIFLHTSPNAEDLIEGYNEAGRNEMEANYQAFQNAIAEILMPYEAALVANGTTPELLAEIIRRSSATFKHQARDEAHLTALLDGLVALVVCASKVP